MDTPDEVTERVRAIPDPKVALELQWDLVEELAMSVDWVLDLHVVVERAGVDHSLYSTVRVARFDAEEESSRRDAHARSRAVAERVGLPLHAPPVEQLGGQGGSPWIRGAGAGPAVSYDVRWEASWWADDGGHHAASGVEPVLATAGAAACEALRCELERRIADRPLAVRTFLGEDRGPRYVLGAPYPPSLPRPDAARELALAEGCRPSRVAAWLVAHDAHLTALDLMAAFADAFELTMEACVPLARWRRGEVDGAALDALLGPDLERARPHWDRARVLREARRDGRSVAACVRAERARGLGTLRLVQDVRRAFGVSLLDAMTLVEACGDPARDAQLDAQLDANIGSRAG